MTYPCHIFKLVHLAFVSKKGPCWHTRWESYYIHLCHSVGSGLKLLDKYYRLGRMFEIKTITHYKWNIDKCKYLVIFCSTKTTMALKACVLYWWKLFKHFSLLLSWWTYFLDLILYPVQLYIDPCYHRVSWWRHHMETISALLALCAGNSPVTGEFPSQRPVTRSYDVFNLRPNKRLRNNRETGDLRRHRAPYDVTVMYTQYVLGDSPQMI